MIVRDWIAAGLVRLAILLSKERDRNLFLAQFVQLRGL